MLDRMQMREMLFLSGAVATMIILSVSEKSDNIIFFYVNTFVLYLDTSDDFKA